MATPEQIAANRRNAQKSTGPKTAQGKQNSSKNSIKHGLLASIIPQETEGWQELLLGLYESLRPQDELQRFLVDQIAHSMLRLQRSAAFEEQYLKQGRNVYFPPGFLYVGNGHEPPQMPVSVSPTARVADFLDSPPGHLLLRYETAANRQIHKNLALLHKLQSAPWGRTRPACSYLVEQDDPEGAAPSAPPIPVSPPLSPSPSPLPSCPEDARPQAIEPCVSHARPHGTDAPQPGSPGLPAFQPGPSGPGDETEGRDPQLASFRTTRINAVGAGSPRPLAVTGGETPPLQ